MRACSGCQSDYDEQFKFCPHCGTPFGVERQQTGMSSFGTVLRSAGRDQQAELAFRNGNYDQSIPYELSPETLEAARAVAEDMGVL